MQNRCSIIKNRYNLDIATENRITGSVKDSPSKAAKKDPHHQNSSRIAPSPANVLFEHDGHLTGEKNKSKLNATTDKIMILDGNDGAAAENSSSFGKPFIAPVTFPVSSNLSSPDSADKGCSAHAGRGEKSGDNSLAAGIKDEEVIEGWGRSATGTSPCP